MTKLPDYTLKQAENEDTDDIIRDLVEYTLKKLDIDHDGKITFSDFLEAVKKEILLLEVLGQCLPSDIVSSQL